MSQHRHDHSQHDHGGHGHGPAHDHNHDHGHVHSHDHDHKGHSHAAAAQASGKAHGHHHGHHHGHGHGHHHHHHGSNETRLFWALVITAVFTVVEAVGGILAGSLALVADSVHMLTDAASLVLALFALRVAKQPADTVFPFGRARYEVLAAFVNGLALLLLSAWIIVEGLLRLIHPEPVQTTTMLIIATLGFLANLISFLVLRDGEDSLNLRGAVLHVIGDLLGSAAAMVAAVVIMIGGWTVVDPILSIIVALLILRGGWHVTRQSAHILLEGSPPDFDSERLATDLAANVPGVTSVHHLHAWSLTDNHRMMTLHAVMREGSDGKHVLDGIQNRLKSQFGIDHVTVQLEHIECSGPGCQPPRRG